MAESAHHVDVWPEHSHARGEPPESEILPEGLRWANDHIAKIIASLHAALEQYEQAEQSEESVALLDPRDENAMTGVEVAPTNSDAPAPRSDRKQLAARIASLKNDIIKTLREVVETVSKYTGGALPENARMLIRQHLTSLPRKWQLAMMTSNSRPQSSSSSVASELRQRQQGDGEGDGGGREKNIQEGAQRVLVLAKEGLDMMAQVSGVLDGTIASAEEWCDRLGKKRGPGQAAGSPQPQGAPAYGDGDVKMG
jgi:hypothetical protein